MRIMLITLGIVLGISAGGIILVSIRRLNEVIREFFTRIVLIVAFCLCLSGLCFAQTIVKEGIPEIVTAIVDPDLKLDGTREKTVVPEKTEISVTNEERLTIQNVQLQIQNLQLQLDSYFKQLVEKYKIGVQGWSYDPTGKFVKIKQPVKE